jgi:hypothetical protein
MSGYRYEYMTLQCDTEIGRMHHPDETTLVQLGWQHAWADITSEGVFYVFRRERPESGKGQYGFDGKPVVK